MSDDKLMAAIVAMEAAQKRIEALEAEMVTFKRLEEENADLKDQIQHLTYEQQSLPD